MIMAPPSPKERWEITSIPNDFRIDNALFDARHLGKYPDTCKWANDSEFAPASYRAALARFREELTEYAKDPTPEKELKVRSIGVELIQAVAEMEARG